MSDATTRRGPPVPEAIEGVLAVGTVVADRYRILAKIGSGGMGHVYRAHDRRLDREIALKRLKAVGRAAERRLAREARAMAQLNHPNVVPIYDVALDASGLTLAMEYVPGATLREWLAAGRSAAAIRDAFVKAGRGLAATHAHGLVQRDFKPSNVLVSDDGRVLLTDFGVARSTRGSDAGESSAGIDGARPDAGSTEDALTERGLLIGTPRYMAPEQHAGTQADARSDQYSFCLAFWEALTGAPAFDASGPELAAKKAAEAPVWPASVRHPRRLVSTLRRGLDPIPSRRWESMDALLRRLERSGRRRRVLWAALGASAAAVAVGLGAPGPAPCDAAGDRIVADWNDQVAARVDEALFASGSVSAEPTAQSIRAALDRYRGQWQAAARGNCEATLVDRTQSDLVMDRAGACLERSRTHVAAAVETILAQADGAAIDQLVAMVAELPPVSRCRDAEWLAAATPLVDQALAARAQRLEATLARVDTQLAAGNAAAGLASLDAVAPELAALNHPPLLVRATLARGRAFRGLGRFEEAVTVLRQAYDDARALDDTGLAVSAARRLGLHLGDPLGRAEEALLVLEHGIALAQRPGVDPRKALAVRMTRAIVLPQAGRRDEALAELRDLYATAKATLPTTDTIRGEIGMALGAELFNGGLNEQAITVHREVLATRLATVGPDHQDTGLSRLNIAVALDGLGRPAEAADELRIARAIFARAHGERSFDVALCDNNLSVTLANRGEFEAALASADAALATYLEVAGEFHLRTASAHNTRADALRGLARYDEAESEYWAAIASAEAVVGPHHAVPLRTRMRLARLRTRAGKWASTEAMVRELVATISTQLGEDHLETALAWETLGEILMQLRRPAEAVVAFERASEIIERGEARPSATAVIGFKLAKALRESGETKRALQLASQARDALATSSTYAADRELLAEIAAWLQEEPAPDG
ncbi:MAG: protein kinase [Myxococcota bacterium]